MRRFALSRFGLSRFGLSLLALLPAALLPLGAARAEVVSRGEAGFVVRHVVETTVAPESAWTALIEPAGWWNGEHSFSGDAGNLSIDPRPGGCFCEVLPGESGQGGGEPHGGVEHARVIFIDRHKALRLSGALGPLQSEGLVGTLTITLKPVEGGTRLTWEYVVAGFMRYKLDQIAPAVDKVIGEQATRLAEKLGQREAGEAPKPKPAMESGR